MNIKLPDFKQYETGLYKVYCAKCNAKEFANTIKMPDMASLVVVLSGYQNQLMLQQHRFSTETESI